MADYGTMARLPLGGHSSVDVNRIMKGVARRYVGGHVDSDIELDTRDVAYRIRVPLTSYVALSRAVKRRRASALRWGF